MARVKTQYVCNSCGAVYPKWAGRCEACSEWNTITEDMASEAAPIGGGARITRKKGRKIAFTSLMGTEEPLPRRVSGISEFDRVTGGGLVPGSAVLIGGDPGIGKSTLMMQAVARLSKGYDAIYISGEESIDQLRLRAKRLGVEKADVKLAAVTNVSDIIAVIEGAEAPDILIIDSIQTMFLDVLDSAPGTVSQVRASAQELIRAAKAKDVVLLLVGHVTKGGQIAGPRVLEHMVDTVLYFEGDRGHQFRILRGVKNRFGATDEIGVFEMTGEGLCEVPNPSALFLADRQGHTAGAAVFAGIEGSRPLLVEIQALIGSAAAGSPRRAVVGWDTARLSMIIAVLEARCGVSLSGFDIYLNVAGGLKISEPAADLAVAVALVSAYTGEAVPEDMVIFGEIGLAGEIRAAGQMQLRCKEAAKMGFAKAIMPVDRKAKNQKSKGKAELLEIMSFAHLNDLLPLFGDAKNMAKEDT